MFNKDRYRQDYCFTALDIFDNFDTNRVKMPKDIANNKKDKNRKDRRDSIKEYFAYMFAYLLYLIVLDIVQNNVTFVLPILNKKEGCFYVKSFEGEDLQIKMQHGRFEGIDVVASDFKAYQIYYQYVTSTGDVREKPIYISHNVKDIFYENINKGKKYY